jgi:lysophospholipase L1-like esterase
MESGSSPTAPSALDALFASSKVYTDSQISGLSATYGLRRSVRPVARNLHVPMRASGPNNISDGVSTGITTRLAHVVDTACTTVRLAFSNWYDNAGVPADGVNAISVKCYVKLGDGSFWPVLFGGAQTVLIAPGATVLSDPLGPQFAKGDQFFSQTYVSVTSGQKYPLGLTTNNTTSTEGVVAGDSSNGTVAGSATKGYGPWLIVGTPTKALASPVGLMVGDSRVAGYSDTNGSTDGFGWVRRAFDGNLSYLNLGVSGSTAQVATQMSGLMQRLKLADLCDFDFAIVSYGVNDLTAGKTAAQLEGYLAPLYNFLVARGLKVYGATVPPVTTTTDNWQTLGNQTTVASNAERITFNNWMRTTPAPLTGYFEFADAVESARDSGKWKVTGSSFGYTADGTHESIGGYTAEAAIISPAAFGGPVLST